MMPSTTPSSPSHCRKTSIWIVFQSAAEMKSDEFAVPIMPKKCPFLKPVIFVHLHLRIPEVLTTQLNDCGQLPVRRLKCRRRFWESPVPILSLVCHRLSSLGNTFFGARVYRRSESALSQLWRRFEALSTVVSRVSVGIIADGMSLRAIGEVD
jgi:hypothetical protein